MLHSARSRRQGHWDFTPKKTPLLTNHGGVVIPDQITTTKSMFSLERK